MDGQWATLLSRGRAQEQSEVLPSHRVVIGVPERKATSVDSRLGRKFERTRAKGEEWEANVRLVLS